MYYVLCGYLLSTCIQEIVKWTFALVVSRSSDIFWGKGLATHAEEELLMKVKTGEPHTKMHRIAHYFKSKCLWPLTLAPLMKSWIRHWRRWFRDYLVKIACVCVCDCSYHFEVQHNLSDDGQSSDRIQYTHVMSRGRTQEKHYGQSVSQSATNALKIPLLLVCVSP